MDMNLISVGLGFLRETLRSLSLWDLSLQAGHLGTGPQTSSRCFLPNTSMGPRQEPQRPPWDHSLNRCCKPKKVQDGGSWNRVCNGPTPRRGEEDAAQSPSPERAPGAVAAQFGRQSSTSAPCSGFLFCWCSLLTAQVRTPQILLPLAPSLALPCPAPGAHVLLSPQVVALSPC